MGRVTDDQLTNKRRAKEAKVKAERADRIWNRWVSAASIVLAVVGIVGVWVTVSAGFQATASARASDAAALQTVRESDVRSERADAYAAFVDARARLEMFLWSNLWWAGKENADGAGKDKLDAAKQTFFTGTIPTHGDLKSSYVRALMVAKGTRAGDILQTMNAKDEAVLTDFKCTSGAACDSGAMIGSSEDVRRLLIVWTDSSRCLTDKLIQESVNQLQATSPGDQAGETPDDECPLLYSGGVPGP